VKKICKQAGLFVSEAYSEIEFRVVASAVGTEFLFEDWRLYG
jgi:hypothetical protein